MVKVINLADGVVHEWDDYAVNERGWPEYGTWRFLDDVSKEDLAARLAYALGTGGSALPVRELEDWSNLGLRKMTREEHRNLP